MKRNFYIPLMLATITATSVFTSKATVFFSDNFTNGSTLNSASPANPTPTNTAYEMVSSKAWSPAPTMTANDLKMGIAATSSGYFQAQALFATNQIALTQTGDYIQLTVAFTNTTGLLTAAGQLGIGLYNSGQVKPVAGGINNLLPATFTGFAQGWQGYASALNFSGAASRILTRPAQALATIQNQDLITFGTSSSYGSGSVVGTAAGNATLVAGSNYTEVLTITLIDANSLAITNTLYGGPVANGLVITNFGAVATTPFLASGFDALAIGYCGRSTAGGAPLFEISSIKVDGSVTTVSGPPTIDTQPVAVNVANNGSCLFQVAATGFNVTYQWRRNNTNLLNGGNISGATTSALIINNASSADALSGANGYYCVVSGAGNFSVNTDTNSLTLVSVKNLVWDGGAGSTWDLNNTASWVGSQTFNYGDAVTFNDVGAGVPSVTLSGSFLSASKWTVTGTTAYAFSGSGSFAGNGSLIFNSGASGNIQMDLNNTHTGGTVISNSNPELLMYLAKYQVLGSGPVTYAKPGKMEIVPVGTAVLGIPDVTVSDDFTNQFDGTGTFAGVFLGNISGTANKTLTITPSAGNINSLVRFRVYGTNTVCNANISLNPDGSATDQAQYNGTVFAPYGGSGSQTYNGTISGAGGLIQRGNCTTYLNAANTYTGGSSFTAGAVGLGHNNALGTGPINLTPENGGTSGSGIIFASGGVRTIANTVQYPSGTNNATLIISGTNNLTLTSAINLAGVDGVGTSNRTFTANNAGATTFSGIISDGGLVIGLVKNGTNTLYLNGVNTYSGLTTVSAGVLAGSGSIAGSTIVTTNASIGGGAATGIGTLTVGGNLTLTNGGGFFRVNRSGLASDKVVVTGVLTNIGNGTITVSNLGATLQAGDIFTVFNKALSNGAAMTVTGGLTSGLTWSNSLAANGTIQVVVAGTDLAITKTGPATVLPAASYSYTITATNQGASLASSVVVTDTIPAGLTFVSASGGGVNNSGVVSWALGSLNPAQASNLTLTVTAPLYGSLTNKASVSSATTDLVPANDISAAVITVVTPSSSQPKLTNSVSGSLLTLSWPVDHTGWRLQVQTNTLVTGLSGNWSTVSGSTNINSTSITINPANASVYYRLVYP